MAENSLYKTGMVHEAKVTYTATDAPGPGSLKTKILIAGASTLNPPNPKRFYLQIINATAD
jgi:hypothetical protein